MATTISRSSRQPLPAGLRVGSLMLLVAASALIARARLCSGFQSQQPYATKRKREQAASVTANTPLSSAPLYYSQAEDPIDISGDGGAGSIENVNLDVNLDLTDHPGFRSHVGFVNEYERDADFYRRRNEAYCKQQEQRQQENASSNFPASVAGVAAASSSSSSEENLDSINTSLMQSFNYVEKTTNSLLKGNPLLALSIFAAAGLLVAYMSGYFFLSGYIENVNPAENQMIPYWDEPEIHTIQRVR